jgi:divinyl chlorophyllide a 8-vinyl-reductase
MNLDPSTNKPLAPLRVFVLGATGTVGRATVAALVAQGHRVVCLVRNRSGVNGTRMAR